MLNSFVFDVVRDPAIYLNLAPQETRAKLGNTMALELRCIG